MPVQWSSQGGTVLVTEFRDLIAEMVSHPDVDSSELEKEAATAAQAMTTVEQCGPGAQNAQKPARGADLLHDFDLTFQVAQSC